MTFFRTVFATFFLVFPLLLFPNLKTPCFSYFQSDIEPLNENGTLKILISERVLEIEALKKKWEPLQDKVPPEFSSTFQTGSLELEQEGAGGTYILYDSSKNPKFVIKPIDEDILCLNNPKGFASPFNDREHRVKPEIPLYRSSLTEVLCYELAKLCRLDHITPMTYLSTVSHPCFFYLSEEIKPEKLCSIQTYIENSYSLHKILGELFALNVSEEELQEYFDQEDFEDINLFIWLTYDTDAHPENFRVYPKRVDEKGLTVYGLYKIDNSLSFPEKNLDFFNALMYFPNALQPISSKIRQKIKELPLEKIDQSISKYGLESTSFAFHERVSLLKKLTEEKEMTYYECNLRLSLIEKG